MSNAFGQDRTPGEDVRVRRNSQSWQDEQNLVTASGAIGVDQASGALFVRIVAPLQITSNSIGIDLGDGLAVDTDQLVVDLATNPGLEFNTGDLRIALDSDPGLALAAGGLSVSLAADSGLTKVGGLQIALDSKPGLALAAGGLSLALDTDPGLALAAGGLSVALDGGTLALGASGLSVTDPAGRQAVTSVQTGAYSAAWGETVRVDPSGGAFTVTLPTAAGNAGRRLTVKNVTDDTTAVTCDGDGAETVDGAADATISTARGSLTFESDGANVMIVAST